MCHALDKSPALGSNGSIIIDRSLNKQGEQEWWCNCFAVDWCVQRVHRVIKVAFVLIERDDSSSVFLTEGNGVGAMVPPILMIFGNLFCLHSNAKFTSSWWKLARLLQQSDGRNWRMNALPCSRDYCLYLLLETVVDWGFGVDLVGALKSLETLGYVEVKPYTSLLFQSQSSVFVRWLHRYYETEWKKLL